MIEAINMNEFRDGVENLEEEHLDFINEELGITEEQISQFTDDEVNDKIYEPMCDIEIEEISENDSIPESTRCKIASDIVTILGNSMAEYRGYID